MKKIELKVLGLTTGLSQANNFAVLLGEIEGNRQLPIVVGATDAQSIAIAFEHIQPRRPLTHDLLRSIITTLGAEVIEVVICKLDEGLFYSKVVISHDKGIVEVDSRTSDAIAVALRHECPIYCYQHILEQSSITVEHEIEEEPKHAKASQPKKKDDITDLSDKKLNEMLSHAIENEDYLLAANIRDELKRRTDTNS